MAAFLKSVSIFLMQGRRASRASEAQQRTAAAAVLLSNNQQGSGPEQRETRRSHRGSSRHHQGSGKRVVMQPVVKKSNAAAAKCSSAKLVDSLRRRTHFSRAEVEALLKLHRSLAASARRRPPPRGQPPGIAVVTSAGSGEGRRALLDRASFRELLHNSLDLTEEVFMERIFNAFDRRGEGAIDGERWVLGLSVLLRGTPAERRSFCFNVYDLNGDGYVSREEVLQLLQGCLAAPAAADDDPDEGVRDLADMALRKMDADRDGKLSFADFEAAVSAEPLLLEAFGNCLPSDHTSDSFIATLF